jgi:hypothetical protein
MRAGTVPVWGTAILYNDPRTHPSLETEAHHDGNRNRVVCRPA